MRPSKRQTVGERCLNVVVRNGVTWVSSRKWTKFGLKETSSDCDCERVSVIKRSERTWDELDREAFLRPLEVCMLECQDSGSKLT